MDHEQRRTADEQRQRPTRAGAAERDGGGDRRDGPAQDRHDQRDRRVGDEPVLVVVLDRVGDDRLLGGRQSVRVVDEDAGADADGHLVRGEEDEEDDDRDAAHRARATVKAAQQDEDGEPQQRQQEQHRRRARTTRRPRRHYALVDVTAPGRMPPQTTASASGIVTRRAIRRRTRVTGRSSQLPEQRVVEEAHDAALVLLRRGGDPGHVLAVRDLPDLLRLARGGVEALVRHGLRAALAVLAVDEEHGRRRDLRHVALQARWRKLVREDRQGRGEHELGREARGADPTVRGCRARRAATDRSPPRRRRPRTHRSRPPRGSASRRPPRGRSRRCGRRRRRRATGGTRPRRAGRGRRPSRRCSDRRRSRPRHVGRRAARRSRCARASGSASAGRSGRGRPSPSRRFSTGRTSPRAGGRRRS